MPLYEYQCDACGHRFEKIQKFSDPLLEVCAKCGKGPVRKLLSSPAIQFKGSGWYITDYAKKSGSVESSGSTKSSDSKGESKSESKSDGGAKSDSSESKPAASPAKTD